MTTSELRNLALLLRSRVSTMHGAVRNAYLEAASWTLDGADEALPSIGQVKAVLAAYEAADKPGLAQYDEIRAVKMSADDAATLPTDASLSVAWANVTGKPDVALVGHTHTAADIADLPTGGDAKVYGLKCAGTGVVGQTTLRLPVFETSQMFHYWFFSCAFIPGDNAGTIVEISKDGAPLFEISQTAKEYGYAHCYAVEHDSQSICDVPLQQYCVVEGGRDGANFLSWSGAAMVSTPGATSYAQANADVTLKFGHGAYGAWANSYFNGVILSFAFWNERLPAKLYHVTRKALHADVLPGLFYDFQDGASATVAHDKAAAWRGDAGNYSVPLNAGTYQWLELPTGI